MLRHLSLPLLWSGASITDCLSTWLSNHAAPSSLAIMMCWQIWLERNKALFEDSTPSVQAVFYRILAHWHWQPSSTKALPPRAMFLNLPLDHTVACFDGAAVSSGLCCGAGGTFKFHPTRTTKWFLSCGVGSNTKAELLGLWTTLTLALFWSIHYLCILGDSKVIVDWFNGKCKLQSSHVEGWKLKTQQLANFFSALTVSHLPRAHNSEADALSKRALPEVAGRLHIFHSDGGTESQISTLNLFES